jgi:DNA gyrase subunit B
MDVAIAFTDADGDQISAYTNGLVNKDGGEHVRSVVDAMSRSLKPWIPKGKGKKKDDGPAFTLDNLRDGLVGLVNCKIAAPKFNNQPKDKLVDERVYDPAVAEMKAAWSKFWDDNKNLAKNIVSRAMELNKAVSKFKADKKMIKKVNAAGTQHGVEAGWRYRQDSCGAA